MKAFLFSKEHLWVKLEESGEVLLGITDYAQNQLGGVVFVNLPEPGTEISEGVPLGDIESVKTVSDLISPITGTVLEVNELVIDNPGVVNEDPYENWLVKVLHSGIPDTLMNQCNYEEYTESL